MNKRSFLKKSAILGVAGLAAGSVPLNLIASTAKNNIAPGEEKYKLPDLDYAYDALAPYIDARTMEIHHSKHHAGYTAKFNAALAEAGLEDVSLKDLFKNVSTRPEGIRNNGGGYYNHKLFWKSMSPKGGGKPTGDLLKAIEKSFGSFDNFRTKFSAAAATRFGSGWAWLIITNDGLEVTSSPNQDNPLMDVADVQGQPILCIDVWEHAYYLNYQNRRTDYIAAFWNVVNWDFVSEYYAKRKG